MALQNLLASRKYNEMLLSVSNGKRAPRQEPFMKSTINYLYHGANCTEESHILANLLQVSLDSPVCAPDSAVLLTILPIY